jgi:secondary thiamine-phosphate synthase enzyme
MQTLAPTFVYRHTRVLITTERRTEFVDLTDGLERLVAECPMTVGMVNIQSLHTTAGIVVNEGEPLLMGDFERVLDDVVPAGEQYRHDDITVRTVNLTPGERPNGSSHCKALFLPSAVCLNVLNGRLVLGRWQRVFLAELDGPRRREISVLMMGEGVQ